MKHLKFGEAGKARVTITIRDLQVIEDGDVLRMSCTLVGKLEGGGSARSKISFGGKLDERKKLERQVIAAAAEGLMVRLAEMAKQREIFSALMAAARRRSACRRPGSAPGRPSPDCRRPRAAECAAACRRRGCAAPASASR